MSIINDEYKHIFIHIPKCAGSSMEQLDWVGGSGHDTLDMCYKNDKEKTEKYFKWCFIRHPFSRIASAYFCFNGETPIQKEIVEKYRNQNDFKGFILNIEKYNQTKDHESNLHLLPLEWYIDSDIEMNFIGRFENINGDFLSLQNLLELPHSPLPHKNATNYSGKKYQELYDEEMEEVINCTYGVEIDKYYSTEEYK